MGGALPTQKLGLPKRKGSLDPDRAVLVSRIKGSEELVCDSCGSGLEKRNLLLLTACAHPDLPV